MRVLSALPALALAALLAGCTSTPGPGSPGAEQEPTLVRLPVDARLPLNWESDCCLATTEAKDMPRLPLARNETAVALSVLLDTTETLPPGAEAVLRAECEAAVGPECPVLGEATGPLPLRLDVPSAAVPAGATLRFSAHLVGGAAVVPVASAAAIEVLDEWVADTLWASLVGEVQALRDPAAPPPLVEALELREVEGDLWCNPVDLTQPPYTNCSAYARPWYFFDGFGAPGVRFRLELTWTATRETARELVVVLSCTQADVHADQGCPELPPASVTGPSPLVLEASGRTPADAVYRVDVHTPRSVEARITDGPVAENLPQPYHLRFEATMLREPGAGDEGDGRTSRD